MNLIPQASMPSFVEGVRVTGSSVGVASPMSVITPVHTAPSVAVAWHPYSLSLHMKEKTSPVMLYSLGQGQCFRGWNDSPRAASYCTDCLIINGPSRCTCFCVTSRTTTISQIGDIYRERWGKAITRGRVAGQDWGWSPVHVAEESRPQQHPEVVRAGEARRRCDPC